MPKLGLLAMMLWLMFVYQLGWCAQPLIKTTSRQTQTLPVFHSIHAQGRINLTLHTGFKRSRLTLKGQAMDVANLKIMVQNDTLFLKVNAGYPKIAAIQADLYLPFLTDLSYLGVGVIKGRALRTKRLSLLIDNPMTTTLSGALNLRDLTVRGNSHVRLNGIQSPHLNLTISGLSTIQLQGDMNLPDIVMPASGNLRVQGLRSRYVRVRMGGHAHLELAGKAEKLDADVSGHALFNGRYLRVFNSYVKTHDHALATLNTADKQHTLALDASDIYFFDLPRLRADLMADNGAVLDMRDWYSVYLEPYTPLNRDYMSRS